MYKVIAHICLLNLLVLVGSGQGQASGPCGDQVRQESRQTIRDFLDSADSIAICVVKRATATEQQSGRGESIYAYELELHQAIYGSPQSTLTLTGMSPFDQVPELYFGALRRYDELTEDDFTIFGSTNWIEIDGNCVAAPRFVVGYTYVIINGGITSRASFEPVLDSSQNGWLRLIWSRLDGDNRDRHN